MNRFQMAVYYAASFALSLAVPHAVAEVELAWVTQYNGPDSYEEDVRGVVARDGFVYVTGFAYTDYRPSFATVKYDYTGQQIWARVYEGFVGPNQPDVAEALAVDAEGNVFVTGWSTEQTEGGESFVDVATIKYSAAGELMWEARYRSAGGNNQPNGVELDSAGNLYIAGASWVDGGFDLLMLKYAPDGTLLWDRTLGEAGGRWDSAYDLAIDANGNAIAAGYSEPLVLNSAAFLVKYSPDGDLLWERELDGFSNVDAWWRVGVDLADSIYVFGEISPPSEPLHLWTAKYDPAGTLLWERDYGGTANMSNYAGGLAVDPTGGAVVCGQSWDVPNTISIVTLKYEADGTLAWQRLEQAGYAQASGSDVAVDKLGGVYATGFGYNQNGYEDFITLHYTPQGELAWTQIYADPNGRSDYPDFITVDETFNVFVAGQAWVGFENYFDYTTIRYRQRFFGDLDCDGAVDFDDFELFAVHMTGPGPVEPGTLAGCLALGDADADGDLDIADFTAFQAEFSGTLAFPGP